MPDLATKRFKRGINELFDQKYIGVAKELHKDLRCGFAHIVSPQGKILLTEYKHIGIGPPEHLYRIISGNLILVAEDFYNDFKNACTNLIEKYDKGALDQKVYKDFLRVPSDYVNYGDATSISTSGAP